MLVMYARPQFDSGIGRLRRCQVTTLNDYLNMASKEVADLQRELNDAKSEVTRLKIKNSAFAVNIAELHDALDAACVGRRNSLVPERIDLLRKQRDDAQNELRDARKSNADLYAELEKTRKEAAEDRKRHAEAIEEMQGVIDGLTKKLDRVGPAQEELYPQIHDALDKAGVATFPSSATARIASLAKQRDDINALWLQATVSAGDAHTELDRMGVAKCDGDLPARIRSMFGLLKLAQQQNDGAVRELERVRSAGETEYLIHVHRALNEAGAPIWPNLTVQERIAALAKQREDAVAAQRAVTTQRDMARNEVAHIKEAVMDFAKACLEDVE